jgi:hypothetical protein
MTATVSMIAHGYKKYLYTGKRLRVSSDFQADPALHVHRARVQDVYIALRVYPFTFDARTVRFEQYSLRWPSRSVFRRRGTRRR